MLHPKSHEAVARHDAIVSGDRMTGDSLGQFCCPCFLRYFGGSSAASAGYPLAYHLPMSGIGYPASPTASTTCYCS